MQLISIAAADQGIPDVRAVDGQIVRKIWFKTKPVTKEFCHRVAELQLWSDSNDQGHVDNRDLGNYTWFELAVFPDEESEVPKMKADRELVWKSHYNGMEVPGSRHYGIVFDRRAEILDDLEVRSFAQL